jgi:2,3-bisphosphoglycerate-independent phosphoglycerate mutase
MKYIVFLGDGMADLPFHELDGRTPLMAADKPNMDRIAREGLAGMSRRFRQVSRREAIRPTCRSWDMIQGLL